MDGGLDATAPLWPDIARAFAWVHRAAHVLNNADALPAAAVAHRLDGLCGAMLRHRALAGGLAGAVEHFAKVTRSYRAGLFHCHAVPDLQGTNNALEGLFGSHRHHERRATGRRSASTAMVLRGPVCLPAAVVRERWRALRAQLDTRRAQRVRRTRFRRDPLAYLTNLEDQVGAMAK